MRRTIRSRKPIFDKKQLRINFAIRADIVNVIDEDDVMRGKMNIRDALNFARDRGYDLVEVSPKEIPPVVKLMDYGEYKYKREKQEQKNKLSQKKIDTKGIRLSLRISQHDLEFRREKTKNFIEEGNKVKIDMILKGRERQHQDLAMRIVNNFIAEFGDSIRIEQPLQKQGGVLSMVIGKKS